MSVSLKAQKLVTVGDLLEYSGQFKGLDLHLRRGVNMKDRIKRTDLVQIAAANLKVRPEAMAKIALKFTTGDKYVTRQELGYLFAQCFLKAGCGAPLSKAKCEEIDFNERMIMSTRPLEGVRNPKIFRKMKDAHQPSESVQTQNTGAIIEEVTRVNTYEGVTRADDAQTRDQAAGPDIQMEKAPGPKIPHAEKREQRKKRLEERIAVKREAAHLVDQQESTTAPVSGAGHTTPDEEGESIA